MAVAKRTFGSFQDDVAILSVLFIVLNVLPSSLQSKGLPPAATYGWPLDYGIALERTLLPVALLEWRWIALSFNLLLLASLVGTAYVLRKRTFGILVLFAFMGTVAVLLATYLQAQADPVSLPISQESRSSRTE